MWHLIGLYSLLTRIIPALPNILATRRMEDRQATRSRLLLGLSLAVLRSCPVHLATFIREHSKGFSTK